MKKILALIFVFVFQIGCTLTDPEMMEMLQALQAQNDKLLQEITGMKEQLSALDVKYQVIQAGLADNKKDLETLKGQMDALKTQIASQLVKLNQLTAQLEVQGSDLEKLSAEIVKIKASIEELKAMMEELLTGKSPIPTNGLVAWYPFNGNANDESGNGNNGIVNGAALTTDRFLNGNKAFSFETNDYIESEITQSEAFTISAWANFDNKNSFYAIVQHKGKCTRGGGPYLGMNIDGRFRYNHSSCGACSIAPCSNDKFVDWLGVDIPTSSWNHYVVTSDGISKLEFYFNGELIGSETKPNVVKNQYGKQPFTMGLHADGNNIFFLNGDLDDIGLWNRKLDKNEVSKIHKGEKF